MIQLFCRFVYVLTQKAKAGCSPEQTHKINFNAKNSLRKGGHFPHVFLHTETFTLSPLTPQPASGLPLSPCYPASPVSVTFFDTLGCGPPPD